MAGQNKGRGCTMNKILIIDDDRELCALIKRSVQAENIEADFCNTGKEGLQKLREQKYQLVVLDVMMPGMDGFETLTRLGGYIMLFSMISSMFRLLPLPETTKLMLTGLTEITNGIKAASQSPLTPACRYLLAMTFTAFGGCSGLAQTSSMIKGTGLSIKKYGIFKLLMTLITAVLAWSVVTLVYPSAFLPVCLP